MTLAALASSVHRLPYRAFEKPPRGQQALGASSSSWQSKTTLRVDGHGKQQEHHLAKESSCRLDCILKIQYLFPTRRHAQRLPRSLNSRKKLAVSDEFRREVLPCSTFESIPTSRFKQSRTLYTETEVHSCNEVASSRVGSLEQIRSM